ncbi:FimB/Mfa2 family fimbrial subunit [Bacteroides sp.]|uniref:FimB/Mfa2 family fimbrial subunit n=1 Tax=Bacteroides sp. TaxID=29523 RepID=UPI0025906C1E|nr:FimB/Mfa2 family fimbrial subunit [Bacteroides sp.]
MRNNVKYILLALLVGLFSSCIDDKAKHCNLTLKYRYLNGDITDNIFDMDVDRVSTYIFNKEGLLLDHITDFPELSLAKYSKLLEDFNYGEYQFVGVAEDTFEGAKNGFEISRMKVGSSTIDDLYIKLNTLNDVSKNRLQNMLVGHTTLIVDDLPGEIVIPVRNIMNNVRVLLVDEHHPENIDVDDYDISIVDEEGNVVVNYDYTVQEDGPITYLPYETQNITSSLPDDDQDYQKVACAQFSLSRLVDGHDIRLIVKPKGVNYQLINVSLLKMIDYAKQKETSDKMSFQDYLDFRDNFVITLFLKGNSWVRTKIRVNEWIFEAQELNLGSIN